MQQKLIYILTTVLAFSFFAFEAPTANSPQKNKGKLFIIGGGKRPAEMIDTLAKMANLNSKNYALVLPFASSEPDTSAFYGKKQFSALGYSNVRCLLDSLPQKYAKSLLDSVRSASLIYITGGDQNKFMHTVKNTPLFDALHFAYKNGAIIAGTSAGAAIMSHKMITGNQHNETVYSGEYPTIQANNIELAEGMGFVKNIIVDQHFIKRSRMNRLIAVAAENPNTLCLGIDESTAVLIENNKATVFGMSQVIALKSVEKAQVKNQLLGANNMQLSVYLPGHTFELK